MPWVGTETGPRQCRQTKLAALSEEAQEGEPKEEMDVDKEDGGKGWNKEVVIVPVYSQHSVIFPYFPYLCNPFPPSKHTPETLVQYWTCLVWGSISKSSLSRR